MRAVKDELIAGKIRDVDKARTKVGEAIDNLYDEISLAISEKRITPKEAAAIRSGIRGGK
jgi:hypothetical protein